MKTLQEIKTELSGNIERDLQTLNSYLFIETKTEQEFYKKLDICKYMKSLCQTNAELFELYRNHISVIDVEYFRYLYSKLNTKHGKKQWEFMLAYTDKAIQYFDLPQNELSFDGFEDYYIYTQLNKDKNIKFYMGIESWIYYEQAIAYKNLGNLDIAIELLKYCIKCSPMTFSYYEQLFSCLEKSKMYEELKDALIDCHKIITTIPQLSIYYYYWSIYFYNIKNYSVSKTCAYFSSKHNLVFTYRNRLVEIIDTINSDEKIITPYFNIKPEDVLKKYGIPSWFSEDTMMAVLGLYTICVARQVSDRQILKQARNMLHTFRMKDYIEEVNTNILTEENMYHFNTYKMSLKLSKKWTVVDIIDSPNFKEGTVFFALDNDDNFSIFVKNLQGQDYDELCTRNVKQLNISGFNVINESNFLTLNNKNIKFCEIKVDKTTNMLSAFINIDENYFCNVYMTFKDNFEERKKEFLKIINSITVFCPIIQQDN